MWALGSCAPQLILGRPRRATTRSELILADLYILLLPVQIGLSDSFRLAPSDFALVALFGLFLAHRTKFSRTGISGWHVSLGLALTLGTFVSTASGDLKSVVLINKDLGFLVLLGTYYAFFTLVRGWDIVEHVLRVFVLAATVHAALALVAFFTVEKFALGPLTMNESTGRLCGFLIDPNAFGGVLGVALVIQLAGNRRDKFRVGGIFGLVCSAVLAVGLLMTYSRSAWLGCAITVLVAALLRPARLLVMAALGACAVSVPLLLNGMSYLKTVTAMAERPTQVEGRFTIIGDALDMFWHSPILGGGLGAFANRHGVIVHNSVLWCLAELGALGLVSACGLIFWVLVRGFSARRATADKRRQRLIACLVFCHIFMFGLAMGIEALYQRQWWVCMGFIAGASVLVRQKRARDLRWRFPDLVRRS